MKKKLVAGLLFGLSLNVYAVSNLVIVNQTNADSTARINGGLCSNDIPGGGGITYAHSTNTISASVIGGACFFTPHNCRADVYMTDDCSGPMIGSVLFDKNTGVQSISSTSSSYALSNAGAFNIIIAAK